MIRRNIIVSIILGGVILVILGVGYWINTSKKISIEDSTCSGSIDYGEFIEGGIFTHKDFDSFLSELKKQKAVIKIEEEKECSVSPEEKCLPYVGIDITIPKGLDETAQVLEDSKTLLSETIDKIKSRKEIKEIGNQELLDRQFDHHFYVSIYLNEEILNKTVMDNLLKVLDSLKKFQKEVNKQYDTKYSEFLSMWIDIYLPNLPLLHVTVKKSDRKEFTKWLREKKKIERNDCCFYPNGCPL